MSIEPVAIKQENNCPECKAVCTRNKCNIIFCCFGGKARECDHHDSDSEDSVDERVDTVWKRASQEEISEKLKEKGSPQHEV